MEDTQRGRNTEDRSESKPLVGWTKAGLILPSTLTPSLKLHALDRLNESKTEIGYQIMPMHHIQLAWIMTDMPRAVF